MFGLGGMEWLILLVIIVLLFGVGRISKVAKEFGSGIRAFREGLQGKEKDEEGKDNEKKEE